MSSNSIEIYINHLINVPLSLNCNNAYMSHEKATLHLIRFKILRIITKSRDLPLTLFLNLAQNLVSNHYKMKRAPIVKILMTSNKI